MRSFPCIIRPYLTALFFLSLCLTALSAQAGTWSLTATGSGSASATRKPQRLLTIPTTASTGSLTIAAIGNGQSLTIGMTPATASGTATVTVTGTWVPDPNTPGNDPAPASVIVQEQETVTAIGYTNDANGNQVNIVGTVTDDLGGSPDATGQANDQKYTVVSGGSFTVNVSLTAKVSASPGPNYPQGGYSVPGYCSVTVGIGSITISAYTPLITLSGTHDPIHGDNRALTGQQITAHFFAGGAPVTISSYTWSFIGGTSPNPIKDWDPYGIANDGKTPQQLFLLTSTDLTGTDTSVNHIGIGVADLPFYDQMADSVTVKCSVNFGFPDGTTGTAAPQSLPVAFLKPTGVWTASSTDPLGALFDQARMGFAVQWTASITVPSPFSGGAGCFAQIVAPTRQFQRHPIGDQSINCYLKELQTNADGTTAYVLPVTGLDTQFPYPFDLTKSYQDGYVWDVSVTGQSGDAPSASFTTPASDNGGSDWYTAYGSDIFTTWLMYMPSSGGTGSPIWVPLERIDWSWTGNVIKDSSTGQWKSANSGKPVIGSTPDHGVPTDTPPNWNTVNVGSATLRP